MSSAASRLRLIITDWSGPSSWRWDLVDSAGTTLASHTVTLDRAEPEYMLLTRLYNELWRLDFDKTQRRASEAELLRRLGTYEQEMVFGGILEHLLTRAPVTVNVQFPAGAEQVVGLPLEVTLAHGVPIAYQGVTFCYSQTRTTELELDSIVDEQPPALRILAVFALPTGESALSLASERRSLVELIQKLPGSDTQYDLQILQYGVTRVWLEEALADGVGWDVVHMSGHGTAGTFVLEGPDGEPDAVTTTQLKTLLAHTKERLKLIVLSACQSGKSVDLPIGPGSFVPALGTELAAAFDCACVAMRYPVPDRFAAWFTHRLYQSLFGLGLSLDEAIANVHVGMREVEPTASVSTATPVLVGDRGLGLCLRPQQFARESPSQKTSPRRSATRRAPPAEFVGNGSTLRVLNLTLQMQGASGVLIVGMPGVGKTSCALEIVSLQAVRFNSIRVMRVRATTSKHDATRSLMRALRNSIREADAAALNTTPSLSGLREIDVLSEFRKRNILLVLDDLHHLIDPNGQWLDARFGGVVEALVAPGASARTVLISDRQVAAARDLVPTVPATCLSRSETRVLVEEQVLHGVPLESFAQRDDSQSAGYLWMVCGGHPKLTMYVLSAASDAAIRKRAQTLDAIWEVTSPHLHDTLPKLGKLHPGRALSEWAIGRIDLLPPEDQLVFGVLSALEAADRNEFIAGVVLEMTCAILGQHSPPDLSSSVAALAASGLLKKPDSSGWLELHPGLAAAGRQLDRAQVDATCSASVFFWGQARRQAIQDELDRDHEIEATARLIPYLLRTTNWHQAIEAIEVSLAHTQTSAMAARVLPFINAFQSAVTGLPLELPVLLLRGRALMELSPQLGIEALSEVHRLALLSGDDAIQSASAMDVYNALKNADPRQSYQWLENASRSIQRIGKNAWLPLLMDVQKAQLALSLDKSDEALKVARLLPAKIERLLKQKVPSVGVDAGELRLTSLRLLAASAEAEGRWRLVAVTDDRIVDELRRMGSPRNDMAQAQLDASQAMVRAGQLSRAEIRLRAARGAFTHPGEEGLLATTLRWLAEVEYQRGHNKDALTLAEQALRASYASSDLALASRVHERAALFSSFAGEPSTDAGAVHLLAAAVIRLRKVGGVFAFFHQSQVTESLYLVSLFLARAPDLMSRSLSELRDNLWQRCKVDIEQLIGGVARVPVGQRVPDGLPYFITNASERAPGDSVSDVLTFATAVLPPGDVWDVKSRKKHWGPLREAIRLGKAGLKRGQDLQAALERLRSAGWSFIGDAVAEMEQGCRLEEVVAHLDDSDGAILSFLFAENGGATEPPSHHE